MDKFTLNEVGRIAGVLTSMSRQRSLLGINVREGNIMGASLVVAVDRKQGVFYIDEFSSSELTDAVRAGKSFSLRGMDQGVSVFCSGLVAKSIVKIDGTPAYKVEIPKSMLYKQRREYFRVPIGETKVVPVDLQKTSSQLSEDDDSSVFSGELIDISGGGARIVLFKVNDPISAPVEGEDSILRLELPDTTQLMELPVEWRFAKHDDIKKTFTLGLQFINPSPALVDAIQQYVVRAQFAMRREEAPT
ncbi:MAG: flagellar brake protein [Gammaproteobacteria bacterium]|nr:flagellar brake protein [Gammaproteobacteria bacterium]